MSKNKTILFFIGILLSAQHTKAFDIGTRAVEEVLAAQAQPDGTFKVLCQDSRIEIVTNEDFFKGNVCPNTQATVVPSRIFSIQKKGENLFDVVCIDGRREEKTSEDIMGNRACVLLIKAGVYTQTEGSTRYYDEQIQPVFGSHGELVSITLIWLRSGYPAISLPCEGVVCSTVTEGIERKIEILSEQKYRYTGSGSPAIFEWRSDALALLIAGKNSALQDSK